MRNNRNAGLTEAEQELTEAEELLDRAEELERRAAALERRAAELERQASDGGQAQVTTAHSTDITMVLDRSGSMASTKDVVIGGFNEFLAEQRKVPGEVTMTLVQFDDQYEVLYEGRPLVDVADLDEETFQPRGSTALLDAIGQTIARTDRRLADKKECPELVVFVILTDGMENASREYQHHQIFESIREHEEKHGWKFIFLAANQDAILEGARLGIHHDNALTLNCYAMAIGSNIMAKKVGLYRMYAKQSDLAFTDDERLQAEWGDGDE